MTNVPGLGFVVLLAAIAVLVALPLVAAASLVAARITGVRIEWALVGTHATVILVGVAGSVVSLGTDLTLTRPGVLVGLLRLAGVTLAAGLLLALLVEGVPIVAGAALTYVLRETPWQTALRYATAGYALGGIGGAFAGLLLTNSVEAAALGALLAAPGALASIVLDVLLSDRTTPTPSP